MHHVYPSMILLRAIQSSMMIILLSFTLLPHKSFSQHLPVLSLKRLILRIQKKTQSSFLKSEHAKRNIQEYMGINNHLKMLALSISQMILCTLLAIEEICSS